MHAEFNVPALKTICGGIFHSLVTYGSSQVGEHNWAHLHSHLHIPESTVYCVEATENGFRFTCKFLFLTYVHDDFNTERRVIEITKQIQAVSARIGSA